MEMPYTVDQFHGVFRDDNTTRWPAQWALVAKARDCALIVFALLFYPVWSACAGQTCPETPAFGLSYPTPARSIGLLCFAVPPTPRSPLIAPLLCCLVGAQTAFLSLVWSDLGLIAARVVGIGLLLNAGQRHRTTTA